MLDLLQIPTRSLYRLPGRCDPVMIFDVRVLGLDVVKQLVIFHRAANNFEALPSSVGMEIFLNQVGCWNVDFEADIMLTYTSYSVIQMSCSPSTKAFQKNPRQ